MLKFGAVVSDLNLDTLGVVFDVVPKIAKCFEQMDPWAIQAVEAKLPSLAEHTPAEAMATALPVSSSTLEPEKEVEAAEGVPSTDTTKAPIFRDEELELVRAKMPIIEDFLSLAEFNELTHMHNAVPPIIKFLVDLETSKVGTINSLLCNATKKLENAKMMLVDNPVQQMQECSHFKGAANNMTIQDL